MTVYVLVPVSIGLRDFSFLNASNSSSAKEISVTPDGEYFIFEPNSNPPNDIFLPYEWIKRDELKNRIGERNTSQQVEQGILTLEVTK